MSQDVEVLLVEDDAAVQVGVGQALELAGIEHAAVGSAEEALTFLGAGRPGVLISDIRLPGRDGLSLLEEALRIDPLLPVVVITGHGDVSVAVSAMRAGAYDFIEKPFASERLVGTVQRALEKRRLSREVETLRRELRERDGIDAVMLGQSPAMQQVRTLVQQLADTAADVLVLGETGTGKEVVARALHQFSPRRAKPFVAINCAALPEPVFESEMFGHEAGAFTGAVKPRVGKFEFASGGTLFLDEIESMPLALQAKLLRVLQERVVERLGANRLTPVDVRVVAATKEDLAVLSEQGGFRADLYYRLNVVMIALPPLRARKEDIPLLFEHFVLQAAARHHRPAPSLTQAQMARLMEHHWPGNVRELRNYAERAVLGVPGGGPDLRPAAGSPAVASSAAPLAEQVEAFERAVIIGKLRDFRGSVPQAAEALGLPRKTLYDKLQRHGIQPAEFR
ncbi:sigma 54-interacting transcriptional regulator [Oleisolibacter albus]|uniref:sigma 54-interacting transcriptional regulator n=1 Tax=Oleisolibacter albus TaxID=2171757 RepID=UPI000DF31BA1